MGAHQEKGMSGSSGLAGRGGAAVPPVLGDGFGTRRVSVV
jgi:hypothetical protein